MAHKPALIVSVSSSSGGAYPVAELRMSSYKNTRICYIPDHVIVRNVEKVFNTPGLDKSNADDFRIKTRLIYSLEVLRVYAESFKSIRKSSSIDLKKYSSGM